MTGLSGNASDVARALPFAGLLLTIALTPLAAPQWWHCH